MPGQLIAVPTPDTKWEPQMSKRARRAWRLTIAAFVLALLALLLAAAGSHNSKDSHVARQRVYRQLAEMVAYRYLDGESIPISTVSTLTMPADEVSLSVQTLALVRDRVTYVRYDAGQNASGKPIIRTQIDITDTFLAYTTSGQTYLCSVPLIATKQGPLLAALPALRPVARPIGGSGAQTSLYVPGTQVTLTSVQRALVASWAQAWVTDNEEQLYALSDDPASVHFVGLGHGWALYANHVIQAVQVSPKHIVALVQLQLGTPAQVQQALADNSTPEPLLNLNYAVMLGQLNRAEPAIEAWGPVSDATQLTRWQNALPGLQAPAASSSLAS
jgi:hypothetical protein